MTKQLIAIAIVNEKAESQSFCQRFQRKSNAQLMISIPANVTSLKSWTESLWSAIRLF